MIKQFALRLSPWLGFNRAVPRTRVGRVWQWLNRGGGLLALLYLFLQAFPQVAFAHSATVGNITVYSRVPLLPSATLGLKRASRLLQRSEIADANRHQKVFVCDSPWLLRLFGPLRARSFGFSVEVTNHVFIAPTDFSRDLVHSASPQYNTRSFSSVVAHETTHGLIRHRLGLWREIRLPPWISEGYCDYVAQESSLPSNKGVQWMKTGQNDASPSFRYFTYRQMVRHLLDDRHFSFAQLVAQAPNFKAVQADTVRALQTTH